MSPTLQSQLGLAQATDDQLPASLVAFETTSCYACCVSASASLMGVRRCDSKALSGRLAEQLSLALTLAELLQCSTKRQRTAASHGHPGGFSRVLPQRDGVLLLVARRHT